jgi:hypothetical protein
VFGYWCQTLLVICFGIINAPVLEKALCHKFGLESGIFTMNGGLDFKDPFGFDE